MATVIFGKISKLFFNLRIIVFGVFLDPMHMFKTFYIYTSYKSNWCVEIFVFLHTNWMYIFNVVLALHDSK